VECDPQSTAVVFIDPHKDVLSPERKNWAAVGASVTENKTVEHMLEAFEAAKSSGHQVSILVH
jgi:nicotinamidase-related amidase